MNKKIIFIISVIINIILALVLVFNLIAAADSLNFEYVEEDTIRPDSMRTYLDRENYGVVASLSRMIRGGEEPAEEDEDYYRLGEYADLLFMKEIFARSGNEDAVKYCEDRVGQIRGGMPEYGILFDKIDQSAKNAVKE